MSAAKAADAHVSIPAARRELALVKIQGTHLQRGALSASNSGRIPIAARKKHCAVLAHCVNQYVVAGLQKLGNEYGIASQR